jgi:hypothetical protein
MTERGYLEKTQNTSLAQKLNFVKGEYWHLWWDTLEITLTKQIKVDNFQDSKKEIWIHNSSQ